MDSTLKEMSDMIVAIMIIAATITVAVIVYIVTRCLSWIAPNGINS
jgi:uncharacterized protein YggT (Ycf19 family)